jgi:hypothetical protein
MMTTPKSEPGLGELFGALARGTGLLVRQEVELASSELSDKTTHAARAVGVIAAGGALVHAGLAGLMVALAVVLASTIPLWASALTVGGVVAATGYAVLLLGLRTLKRIAPVPEQTAQTLKDDKVWVEEQLR